MKEYKDKVFVSEHLERLGLNEEAIKEYDKALGSEDVIPILVDYFKKRSDRSVKLSSRIITWTSNEVENAILLSTVIQFIEDLIIAEKMNFTKFSFRLPEITGLEFDRWKEIKSEFKKLHLSSIAAYVKDNTGTRASMINFEKVYKDYKEEVIEETNPEICKTSIATLEEYFMVLEEYGFSYETLKINEVQKAIDILYSQSLVRLENIRDNIYIDYKWHETGLIYGLMAMLHMVLEDPDEYINY